MPSFLKKVFTQKFTVPLFFAIYLLAGILVCNDYGTPWDEAAQITIGEVSYHYVCDKFNLSCERNYIVQDALPDFYDREYGPFFEVILIALEEMMSFKDVRDILMMRHLLVFIMFWISAIFFYKLALLRFSDWRIALLGAAILVLSPRIFAEAFYNSKDIACLSFYIISAFTLLKFLRQKTLAYCLLHAITCAILINLRMTGIIMPVLTLCFLTFGLFRNFSSQQTSIKWSMIMMACFMMLTAGFTVAFWPYLWNSPLKNFINVFNDVVGLNKDGLVLHWGNFSYSNNLPWHYLPSWLLITIPVLYSAYFLIGCVAMLRSFFHFKFLRDEKTGTDFIFFLLFFLPVIAVIVLKSVVYDGWRHLYFIYPAFLLIALKGVEAVINFKPRALNHKVYWMALVVIPFAITFSSVISFLIKNHPYQYVYFNFIPGKNVSTKFDMDYWGLSYRQALEYVLEKDKNSTVNIAVWDMPGRRNASMIKPEDRKRINYTGFDDATYFISGCRFNSREQLPFLEKFKNGQHPFVNEIYSIKVNENKIMRVYQLKP